MGGVVEPPKVVIRDAGTLAMMVRGVSAFDGFVRAWSQGTAKPCCGRARAQVDPRPLLEAQLRAAVSRMPPAELYKLLSGFYRNKGPIRLELGSSAMTLEG